MGTFRPAVLWTTKVHWRREEAKMKTVALFCCVLASAIADFVPASEEGNTFKKVDAEEAEREGKAFRSVSGDGVLIADGAGEIVVAPGLGGAVVGFVAGPIAAVAVARSCKTEFITELVTQVCEDTVRNVCATEYAEVCEERVATRTEQECGEHVVSEPVEHCHGGHGHEVCEETHHTSYKQECTTSYTTECYGGYRGKRSPTFRNKERRKEQDKRRKEQEKEKENKKNNRRGPRCHRVLQQHCHSVPVSTPSRNCHHVASRPVCSVSHVERRVSHCNPVQVHHPETICRKVPNQVCHQEPAQACRKVRPQPQQRTQEVCK